MMEAWRDLELLRERHCVMPEEMCRILKCGGRRKRKGGTLGGRMLGQNRRW